MSAPFAPASISLGLYVGALEPEVAMRELLVQARLAEEAGFDGVTLSEHHGGAEGYLPNPLLVSTWMLEHLEHVWSGPCPMILPIRQAALVIEDLAWASARFPGRLAAGFAPGFLASDFEIVGVDHGERSAIYRRSLKQISACLSGADDGPLSTDPAVERLTRQPLPLVSAAVGPGGARRAAAANMGILIAAFRNAEESAEICAEYERVGGAGPRVLVRRAWLGDRPSGPRQARSSDSWLPGEKVDMIRESDPRVLGERLASTLVASGASSYNLRLQLPGRDAERTRVQIERFGADILPGLRRELEAAEIA